MIQIKATCPPLVESDIIPVDMEALQSETTSIWDVQGQLDLFNFQLDSKKNIIYIVQ